MHVKCSHMSDPLDSQALQANFLTGMPYSDRFRKLASMWSRLPMYEVAGDVLESLRDNEVTIVVSATGSGKGVVTPRLMLKHFVDAGASGDWRLAITNPKTATTLKNAAFGAELLDVSLGREVGYHFRGAPKDSSTEGVTKLVYVTDGYLLAQSRSDPNLSRYLGVILDEAHERPVPTDFLISVVRDALVRRRTQPLPMRLVVMSATIDPKPFVEYFASAGLRVRVLFAAGVTNYPIRSVFLNFTPSRDKALSVALEELYKVLTSTRSGNVLIFVPTSSDANEGCKAMEEVCRKSSGQGWCAVSACSRLYSKLPLEAQTEATSPVKAPFQRRVIFATNLAESSFTLDDLAVVIDTGLAFHSRWNPLLHGDELSTQYASQAQIRQRMGRTGRTGPGTVIHLYSKKHLGELPDYPDASILSTDITDDFLAILVQTRNLQATIQRFRNLLTPPTEEQLAGSVAFLHFHRALELSPPRHFTDTDHLRELAYLEGTPSAFGQNLYQLAVFAKLGVWNALLLFSGIIYGEVERAAWLVSAFEETGGDLARLWSAQLDDRPRQRSGAGSSGAQRIPMRDHETLARLLAEQPEGLLRPEIAAKIRERAKRCMEVAWGFHINKERAVLDHTPLLNIDARDMAYSFDRTLLAARAYHHFQLSTSGRGRLKKTADKPKSRAAAGLANTFPLTQQGSLRYDDVLSPLGGVTPRQANGRSKMNGGVYEALTRVEGAGPTISLCTWLVIPSSLML
jgi:HrpA-like RNA helicase